MLKKIALAGLAFLISLTIAILFVFRSIPASHPSLQADLPDLVPLRHFYANTESSWRYRLSPDGEYIAWLEAKRFRPALWVPFDFIREKMIRSDSGWIYGLKMTKKCVLRYEAQRSDGQIPQYREVNLRDIDPSKVEWRPYASDPEDGYVLLGTKNNENSVFTHMQQSPNGHSCNDVIPMGSENIRKEGGMCIGRRYENDILIGNVRSPKADNGPRLASALMHFVRLCGGREELF